MNKAVFLDRDATINSDVGHYYVYKAEDFTLNPGVGAGLKLLQDAGFLLIVITNQGGIAKGIYDHEDVSNVHQRMHELLAAYEVVLTDIFYCPHHSDISSCSCRKPKTGLIEQAIEQYNIDNQSSFFIGDSNKDMLVAQAMNIKGLKIAKNENLLPACLEILENSSIKHF